MLVKNPHKKKTSGTDALPSGDKNSSKNGDTNRSNDTSAMTNNNQSIHLAGTISMDAGKSSHSKVDMHACNGEGGSRFGPLACLDEENDDVVPTNVEEGIASEMSEDKSCSKGHGARASLPCKPRKQSKFMLKKKSKGGSRVPLEQVNVVVNPFETSSLAVFHALPKTSFLDKENCKPTNVEVNHASGGRSLAVQWNSTPMDRQHEVTSDTIMQVDETPPEAIPQCEYAPHKLGNGAHSSDPPDMSLIEALVHGTIHNQENEERASLDSHNTLKSFNSKDMVGHNTVMLAD